jgi:hypothetical protein
MRKHHFLSSFVIFVAGFLLSVVIDGKRLASLAQGTITNPATPGVAAQTTQKSSTLQKWEYRIVTDDSVNQRHIDLELNRLGEQGYEICGVAQSGVAVGVADITKVTIVLRRPRH